MYPRQSDMGTSSQRVVCINVGGQLFSTSLATLRKDMDCTLAKLFTGANLATMAIDEAGRCFIDRDPKHFGAILNYLRDGECELPADARGRKELLREAEHYELSGLEELLSEGPYADGTAVADLPPTAFAAVAATAPVAPPNLAVPHATEAYCRLLERARIEAGPENITRCEAALFALMYGPDMAPQASPFYVQSQGKAGGVATGVPVDGPSHHRHHMHGHGPAHHGHHGHHGHRHHGCGGRAEEGATGGFVQLGRRSLSLRSRTSQEAHPLDHAGELGAHASGAELAGFIRRYFSVLQADFLARGYLFQVDRSVERIFLEIPVGAAAPDQASGVLFEGLVQSLAECCVGGEGHGEVRGVSFRKAYRKH